MPGVCGVGGAGVGRKGTTMAREMEEGRERDEEWKRKNRTRQKNGGVYIATQTRV